MKFITFLCSLLLAVSLTGQSRPNPRVPGPSVGMLPAPPQVRSRVLETYGRLPLAFEANQGQTDPQVNFVSRGAGCNLFLTATEAVLTLQKVSRQESKAPAATALPPQEEKSAVLHMRLLGANAEAEVFGQDELPGKSNYFIGNDPKKWHVGVPQYASVRYTGVYPGVDLVYYGNQREMEYDFLLQPGADPGAIRLGIEGSTQLRLIQGDLVLGSPAGDLRLRSPQIYQEANGVRHEVRGRYVIRNKNEVGFKVASYNRSRSLIIDPVVSYSTYLGGGSDQDSVGRIAVDASGYVYLAGDTRSIDFPTANAIQPTSGGGGEDAFIAKLNPGGTSLIFSTYLGGSNVDFDSGIAIDNSGNSYVTGYTYSSDFPTTPGAFQRVLPPGQCGPFPCPAAFVTALRADGLSLLYSTYLGGGPDGQAFGLAVALDNLGHAYVTGQTTSPNFPTTPGAFQRSCGLHTSGGCTDDAFLTKFSADGSSLVYSTYLGGGGDDTDFGGFDTAYGIAVDSSGSVYLTGITQSLNFPVTGGAFQTGCKVDDKGNCSDSFVTKVNPDGSSLVYSTYLGGRIADAEWPCSVNGASDVARGIAVDSSGVAYVVGQTCSTDFPVTPGALQTNLNGNEDAYVSKLNAAGSGLVYSTYLGGKYIDGGHGIAVDGTGAAYVTGFTMSTDFPTKNAVQPTLAPCKRGPCGNADAFVSKLSPDGSGLQYSTYFGGNGTDLGIDIALRASGNAYLAGDTTSTNFPTTYGAFQGKPRRAAWIGDVFVAMLSETQVVFSPTALVFGTQLIGTQSGAKTLTLTNKGETSLNITNIALGGDFVPASANNQCSPGSLGAGASCNIALRFAPHSAGTRSGTITINDSDSASPHVIGLRGIGTVVKLSPKNLAFGATPIGVTSVAKNITLKNVGSVGLNIAGITITGKNIGDFAQANSCGSIVAAGQSCTITVTFTPTAKGTRSAAVSISDDGGGSPQKVKLTGTGT